VIAVTLCLKSFLKRFQITIQTVSPQKKKIIKQMEEILAMKKIPVSNTFNLAHSMVYSGHMWPWFPLFDYINLGLSFKSSYL
jgi:hypothetical protein